MRDFFKFIMGIIILGTLASANVLYELKRNSISVVGEDEHHTRAIVITELSEKMIMGIMLQAEHSIPQFKRTLSAQLCADPNVRSTIQHGEKILFIYLSPGKHSFAFELDRCP